MAWSAWAVFALLSCYTAPLGAEPVYEPIIGFPDTTLSVPQSLLLHSDGNLYGSSGRQLYRLTPAGEFTVVGQLAAALSVPFDTLVNGPDGKLWGVTKTPNKSIFTLDVHSARLKTVADLPVGPPSSSAELSQPQLVSDGNGFFWGTTVTPQADHSAIVYKIDPTSFRLTRVAQFTHRMGSPMLWPPVSDGKGNLRGVTRVVKRNGYDDYTISFSLYTINTRTGTLEAPPGFTIAGRKFSPAGPLAYDGQGSIWGSSSGGLIFRMSSESASVTPLDVPADYSGVKLVADGAGSMWGTIRSGNFGKGSIFKINAVTGNLTTVVEFAGPVDIADLVNDGVGNFWGIEKLSGALFKVNIASDEYSEVADFDMLPGRTPNTTQPYSGLVSDGAGNVWGTFVDTSTQWGALERYEGGAIFKVSASDGIFTEVVQFARPPTSKELDPFRASSLVSDTGGSLWGATTMAPEGVGLIYKVDPVTWESTIVAEAGRQTEGYFPTQPLMSDGKGSLWGMGNYGLWRADDFKSVVFKVNAVTGEVVTVAELPSTVFLDSFPLPFVNDGAGRFWARGNLGDLIRIDEVSGAVTVLASPVEGSFSWGALVSDGKGKLWSTSFTGKAGSGSILEIDPLTGARRRVISFVGQARPSALSSDETGKLWGVLADGTQLPPGHQSIFKLNPANAKLKHVVDLGGFAQRKGELQPPLVYDGAGRFYGTTRFGGAKNLGTIFRFTRGQGLTTLFEFTGEEGPVPGAFPARAPDIHLPTLVRHADGNLYGSTTSGGVLRDGRPGGAGQFYRIRFGPTPTTLLADDVSATTATLNGTLNPNGAVTKASFEYGTDPALGTFWTVAAGELDTSSTPARVQSAISDLDPGTTYYFRVVGANAENAHPQRGAILSFTTPAIGTLRTATSRQPKW